MNDEEKEKYKQYLSFIERTRLLCNTTKELGDLVDYNLNSGNGLSRMGGKSLFLKKAIFSQLAHIVKERTELDLGKVINDYKACDEIIDKYGSRLKSLKRENVCQHLVWHYYSDKDLPQDIAFLAEKMEGSQVPIFILLYLVILPRANSKGGDVTQIEQDCQSVLRFLKTTVSNNILFKELPILRRIEEDYIKHPELVCRIDLIEGIDDTLQAYGSMSTLIRNTYSTRELNQYLIFPDIEGFWNDTGASNVFWQFEQANNCFFLYLWNINVGKWELKYKKYVVVFANTPNWNYCTIIHPRSIESQITGKPFDNLHVAYLDYGIEENVICFEPLQSDSKWFQLRELRRSPKQDFYLNLLDDDRWQKVNEFEEYEYNMYSYLSAITRNDIYIDRPEGGYYRIPKSMDDRFWEVNFSDAIGILEYKGKRYLGFDEYRLYFDVTDEENLPQEVSIVDVIS